MSRGLGRIERAILGVLHRRRQPLLADRWHPLLASPLDNDPAALVRRVRLAIGVAIGDQVPYWEFAGPLAKEQWDEVVDAAFEALDEVHSEPHLGKPLDELIDMMHAAKNPHAVEVSIQRAAKRLEEKCLIQRCYITGAITGALFSERTRTFVCVRITPTTEELADAADLRANAKQVHAHHTREAVNWIKKHAHTPVAGSTTGDLVGYRRAAIDWRDEEQHGSDGKWLKWFGDL